MHPILLADIAPGLSTAEAVAALIRLGTAILVGVIVYRLVRRWPWPRPFRFRFALLHVAAAPLAGIAWFAVTEPLEALVPGLVSDVSLGSRVFQYLFLGIFGYVLVAGIAYGVEGAARTARAEAMAARTQLAALRAQVQPHFLFNALHAVVQLIPLAPERAVEAAELVADLLRATLGEQRDEVTLGEEWNFVSRYLAVERIRFGNRLVIRADLPDALLDDRVPSFALQTLVENAVQHGAAPRVAPTEIVIAARNSGPALTLSVHNSGDGMAGTAATGAGTGLARLRERLAVLYGSAASLISRPGADGGFESVLVVPRRPGSEA